MTRLKKSFFPGWLIKAGAHDGVVISTRIRLGRNFSDLPFPTAANPAQKEEVLKRFEALTRKERTRAWRFIRLADENEVERGLLAERGLVGMESVKEPSQIGLATVEGQSTALLINEEDHLRIQVFESGLKLETSLQTALALDQGLQKNGPFAFSEQFGFLTACPTNVGTGLRASVMMHLPALALTHAIAQVLQAVLHMGLAVRGFYGEGTELRSVFFQISNQMTLGRSEEEIVKQLIGVVRQLSEREEEAREKLLKDHRALLEDKIGRSLGILSGARLLGFEETLDLLSAVRLGVETGLVEKITRSELNEMLLLSQPAHLQYLADKRLSQEEQMARRALLIQRGLKLKKKEC